MEYITQSNINELTDTIVYLDQELDKYKTIVATKKWDATDFEQDYILDVVEELKSTIRILEKENESLKDSRDMYQNRNADLIRQLKAKK
jgi:hypothetical protein